MTDAGWRPRGGGEPGAAPAGDLRLFVALEVPEEMKSRLAALQAALRRDVPGLQAAWVRPGQMHLTLRFLGAVPAPRVSPLLDSLRQALAGAPALQLEVAGVGAFPGWRHPRVVWVGVVDRSPDRGLERLQQAVQSATHDFAGQPADAAFHPHVTLARVKQVPDPGVLEHWAEGEGRGVLGGWSVREVVLVRSQLEAGGSRHTVLEALPLGDKPGR